MAACGLKHDPVHRTQCTSHGDAGDVVGSLGHEWCPSQDQTIALSQMLRVLALDFGTQGQHASLDLDENKMQATCWVLQKRQNTII